MVVICKYPLCGRTKIKGGLSFHHFPVNPDKCLKWVQACGLEWMLSRRMGLMIFAKHYQICGSHFPPESFRTDTAKRRLLIADAMPNILPDNIRRRVRARNVVNVTTSCLVDTSLSVCIEDGVSYACIDVNNTNPMVLIAPTLPINPNPTPLTPTPMTPTPTVPMTPTPMTPTPMVHITPTSMPLTPMVPITPNPTPMVPITPNPTPMVPTPMTPTPTVPMTPTPIPPEPVNSTNISDSRLTNVKDVPALLNKYLTGESKMSLSLCVVPGCLRSINEWKRSDGKGRKPFVFRCYSHKENKKFCKWEATFSKLGLEHLKNHYVCDIHFSASDFMSCYSKRFAIMEPSPEHLRFVKLKLEAVPSLFLDKNENLLLRKKAKELGEADWWRLSDKYDQELDLDQLIKFNKPLFFTNINDTVVNGESNVGTSTNQSDQSTNQSNQSTNQLNQSTSQLNQSTNQSSQSKNHSNLSTNQLDPITSDQVCILAPDKVKLEINNDFNDIPDPIEPTQVELSEEVIKKKRQLFRKICTCPLILPKHWAVHPYVEDNYVTICKVNFSPSEGFTVERAVRITSSMDYPDIHCNGKNISQFMQGQELSCIADVELLIDKVNMW